MQILLTGVLIVLLFNVAVAVVVISRRSIPGSWLLILLLVGTTGAGAVAILGLLTPGETSRFVDIGLIFTALAAVSAAVGSTGQRRRLSDTVQVAAATDQDNSG